MSDKSVVGYRFASDEGSTPQYGKGRVCSEDGCEARLSIYNDGDFCSLHEPMITPRTRGVKIA
ncbi:MAG: hypothetical protein S0880_28895 [Actinomycetota bacterium]|nr:hypothetical protein [Actinomycetota bacterium]